MTIRRIFFMAALLALATLSTVPAFGQVKQPIEGTWIVYVTVDGLPPCQCVAIETFKADGNIEGPANDHFSGEIRGVWTRTGDTAYAFTLVQNNINPDGSAGGIYLIKNTATIVTADAMSGKFTFQIVGNNGVVVFNGTGTFTGTKVKAQ